MRRFVILCLLLVTPLGGWAQGHKATPARGLTVFAAASLTDALTDIGHLWAAQGNQVVFSFAASSTLAKQIEAGAPADLFASADEKWMDSAAGTGHIVERTRADLLGNSLVLVEPAAKAHPITLAKGLNLATVLGPAGRLAVGDPAHVPAGIYARQALMSLGAWEGVQAHLAPAADVRAALRLVAIGEAPAGIVYATDAKGVVGVRVVGVFPAGSHDPITYPFAAVKGGDMTEAQAFLAFLRTEAAQDVFRHYGFTIP